MPSQLRHVLLVLLLLSPFTRAQSDDAAGTTTGVVTYLGSDFVMIQAPGDAARRYWIKPDAAATQPSAAIHATLAKLKPGNEVKVDWSRDDRRWVVSLTFLRDSVPAAPKPAEPATAVPTMISTLPTPPAKVTAPPITATSQPAIALPDESTKSTTGEKVNAMIDDLLAVGSRLTDLPLSMVLVVVIIVAGVGLLLIRRLNRIGRPVLAKRLRAGVVLAAAVFVAFLGDRKIAALQRQVDDLRLKLSSNALASVSQPAPGVAVAAVVEKFDFDPAVVKTALEQTFQDVTLKPSHADAATTVVQIHFGQPLVQAYLAVVDLTAPGLSVKLDKVIDQKWLTSDFAKQNNCSVAVNGEAGQSPGLNSGLGGWRGYMVSDGQVLSTEQSGNPRPFIGFDAKNHAAFRSQASKDRSMPTDQPELIWGRLDALIDGVVQTADERYRQPRTAMGISADGTKLYLLVVDGRQQRYSIGVTRAEIGVIMKAFGAQNAMLCDEGGSSSMYLKAVGGIANVPSDNQGEERPTYTHFGIALQR